MGTERSAASYNQGYRTNELLKLDGDHAPHSQLWYWILGRTGQEPILDLGCGSGHLASLLQRRDHPPHLYLGIDFSKEALLQARKRVPGYRFICDTLPSAAKRAQVFHGATTVFTEVLEHFTKDKAALAFLPSGTRVLATVPRNDSSGHVRHFKKMTQVCARYEKLLEFRSIERVNKAYVFEARRR